MSKKSSRNFANADKLLQDNLKITKSRFAKGKVLKGNVLRIESDINNNNAKHAEAKNRLKLHMPT